jgi:hypothetical protein
MVDNEYLLFADDLGWAPLVDVTQRPILELLANGDTAMARCTTRLIRSLDDPNGVISAFANYVSHDE